MTAGVIRTVRRSRPGLRTQATAIVISLVLLGGCSGESDDSADAPAASDLVATTSEMVAVEIAPVVPDPAELRFQDRLGDEVVPFVNDLELAAPELIDQRTAGIPGAPPPVDQRLADVIWIQDSNVVVRGLVGETGEPFESSSTGGDPVDIGVPGARFTDEQMSAIVYPVDGGTRFIGTDDGFRFGRPDPDVSTEQLIELARTVGTTEQWDASSPGNGVWLFERSTEALVGRTTVVEQGPSRRVRLTRFAEPVTTEQFFAYVAQRAEPAGDAAVGDTAMIANDVFSGVELYAELISPHDVLEVSFVVPSIEELVDVAAATELGPALDGTVDAPPRP